MSFLSYFFLVIFINCVFYLDSSYAVTTEVVSICDSTKIGFLKEWNTANPMYTKYILYLYGTGLSANELVIPSKCDSAAYKGFNDYLSSVYTGGTEYVDAFGFYAQCGEIAKSIERSKLGRGLLVNWPSTIPRFYTQVTIDNAPVHIVNLRYDISYPHDFVTNTAKSTVWTNIYLIEAGQYDASPFYQLPPDLFKQAIQFSAQGFAGLEDYITFTAPAKAKLTQVQGSKGIAWGVATMGCKPPIFKITTNWNTGSTCSFPEIKVTQITEDDSFVCIMQFTNGDTSLNPSVLMQMSYAMAPSLVGRISISTSHAQNILACINPSSSSSSTSMTQFSFWNQWSETTPGTCSPCAPRRLAKSGATPIPRKCNRTLGETSDCCFTCQPGYNSLQYLGDNNLLQQHCIALCPPGRYYDNPKAFMPRCITCPSGKYSQPDSLACKTCDELGFNNAYAGPTGCISCGTRSLAKGDSASCAGCHTFCSPCPAQTYVPILSITCQECPPGWILRTAQSDTCSPCPPGFYASQGRCLQCPTNTFKVNEGNGSCIPCASGYESVPDRTRCIPCTDLNVNVTPFAIYQPGVSGCAAICNPTVSYAQGTNPFVPEGCVSCKSLKVPNGMYATKEDCSNFLPCINLPTSNSTTILKYTGSGNHQGICPWKCIPGYFLQGSTCYQCNVNGFNDTHHIFIDDCNYACIPGLFFRGLTNSDTKCTQRCVNLNTVLYPYASDYFFFIRNNGTRINLRNPIPYRTGFCGSNAIDPTSELGVVRHIGMFGVLLGSGFCGDSMLSSINEECDDGNTINGDGCNHRCLIERNAYWDCDVLGEPCLPNCGWPNLQGFALPAPPPPSSTAPWCTGIAYARDFLKISMSNRGSWMQSNLIPCQCALNPHQTLPYSECNYTNRGCRQCPIGFFQDDLYARCSKCGSTCALGFWTFNKTRGDAENTATMAKYGLQNLDLCGPSIATSQALTFADPILNPIAFGIDQLKLGCAPCSAGALNTPSQVIFTTPDCQWKCRRDYSNVTEPKYYCAKPLNNLGVCNERCLDCANTLSNMPPLPASNPFGWYIQSCADGVGHQYARCANLSDPNARFIGNSPLIGDNTGCPWKCNLRYQMLRGKCVPCGQTTCEEGEMLQLCDGSTTSYYCAPCSLVKSIDSLHALQVWGSIPPSYTDCIAKCEPGFAYQTAPNETCKPCSYLECDLDQLQIPCNESFNTHCLPCPQSLRPNFEFYIPGTCKTRCAQGYALSVSKTSCISCIQNVQCLKGQQRSSECQSPEERLQLPICIPCDPIDIPLNRPSLGRLWTTSATSTCITTCYDGWMFQSEINLTCILCNTSKCAYGQRGSCTNGKLICEACDTFPFLDSSQIFKQPGDCTLICAPGFEGIDCHKTDTWDSSSNLDTLNQNNNTFSNEILMGISLIELQKKISENTTTTTSDQNKNISTNQRNSFPIRTLPHS